MQIENPSEKTELYKKFWSRTAVGKPLIGFTFKSWFPLSEYSTCSTWKESTFLTPQMIVPEAFIEESEALLKREAAIKDDLLRGVCPAQFLPWLCASLGCELQVLPGNILPVDMKLSWEECYEAIDAYKDSEWFHKYLSFLGSLSQQAKQEYPVSYGTVVGPMDLAVKLRGHEQIVFDMVDEPEECHILLDRLTDTFIAFNKEGLKRIHPHLGGYFDSVFNLWAPGPLVRLQEDAMAVLSPALYTEFLKPIDSRISDEFDFSIMHLHTNSRFFLDQILSIENLKAVQINHEPFSVRLKEMIPYYQLVQKQNKLLILRGNFEEQDAQLLMETLDPEGLLILNVVDDFYKIKRMYAVYGLSGRI